MKVAMSISIEAEKAELLRAMAERDGEKLSPFVNRLIDAGLTIERGIFSSTTPVEPDRADVIESAEENVADDRRSDVGDWPTLNEEMMLSEQVSLCVGDEPRGATEIAGYTGIAEEWVQKHLDQLLDQGAITGRKTGQQWLYWRLDTP